MLDVALEVVVVLEAAAGKGLDAMSPALLMLLVLETQSNIIVSGAVEVVGYDVDSAGVALLTHDLEAEYARVGPDLG